MESTELYHVKQLFTLGGYKTLVDLPLPDSSSAEYTPTLIYKARAYIALDDPKSALSLLPSGSENHAVKAVAALAKFESASSAEDKEASLEALRDLCVEVEGDEEADASTVRVIAGTAFAKAGEMEEALESLGAGTEHENLEAVAVTVYIYLSLNRADLAKKEFDRSKSWAEDDLLLGLIESHIGLATGKDGYSNANSFYTEAIANPTLTSPNLLTARGITRLLRNEVTEAKSDFEEAQAQKKSGDAETAAAFVVAAGLRATKRAEVDELWSKFIAEYPHHPLVADVGEKAGLFDEAAQAYEVPALATVSAQ